MRRLADIEPVLSQAMRWVAKETRFHCRPGLADILANNPRLIVALSHSTPLSWLPSAALLAMHACARGGLARRPMGVMDHVFFQVPFVSEIAKFLTQTERPLSYFELSERFEREHDFDLILFPEGSNCFFGEPDQIQEFRSPKFVDLAIRTHSPILLGVHTGSENWAKTLEVSEEVVEHLDFLPRFAFDFLERRLRKTGRFVLPLFPAPMARFSMFCELYHPTLKREDLVRDPMERQAQIRAEADRIRARMCVMLEELRAGFETCEEDEGPAAERFSPELPKMSANLNNL